MEREETVSAAFFWNSPTVSREAALFVAILSAFSSAEVTLSRAVATSLW